MPDDPKFSKAEQIANAITSAISSLISSHNSSNDAHSTLFSGKSDTGHTHTQYLTTHQDISGKEDKTNKVTQLSSSSTDTQYPSAKAVFDAVDNIISYIYPVGSIYISVNSTNPSSLFGGTWVQLKDTFLLACGDTYSSDSSDVTTAQHGEATHTLTTNEMPSHTHTQDAHSHKQGNSTVVYNSSGSQHLYGSGSGTVVSLNTNVGINTNNATATNQNTGGGQAHNNMPPYMSVYMWKRTA